MGAVVATPGDAGSREMVSARDWASRDKSWTKLAMAEPGPPLGQPQSLRSRVRLRRRSDLSPLWLAAWGRGRQSGPRASGPVLQAATSVPGPEPFWAALRPQPVVCPRLCGDHEDGQQGTILTQSSWLVRGRSCGLGGWVPSPVFS